MNRSNWLRTILSAGGLFLASAAVLSAQDTGEDFRWLPWTGCWQSADARATLLCVQQADGGVEFLSVGTEGVVSEESIVADGEAKVVDEGECQGTTTARFSRDGERVYLRESIACGNTQRSSVGIIAMVSPGEWVDIRGPEDGEGAWSRTFQRVTDGFATSRGFPDANNGDDLAARMMRWQASEPSNFDDVVEVFEHTSPAVTRAWVGEQLDPIPVDGATLVRMDQTGLPAEVIDIVVAKAFPDQFVIAENPGAAPQRVTEAPATRVVATGYGPVPFVGIDPYHSWGYWSPWGYRQRYGGILGYQYGRAGWGYGWPYRERVIVVQRNDGFDDFPQRPNRRAQPRNGTGYQGGSGAVYPGKPGSASQGIPGAAAQGTKVRSTGRKAKPRPSGGGGLV